MGGAGTKAGPRRGCGAKVKLAAVLLTVTTGFFPARLAAQYKPEFKMSVVPTKETSWGRAAIRIADAVKFRTNGRIQIKTYFEGQLYAGEQTTEFQLLQQGVADFAIGSTINWSPQVKELNLFNLPFMFPSHPALDAVEAGEPLVDLETDKIEATVDAPAAGVLAEVHGHEEDILPVGGLLGVVEER